MNAITRRAAAARGLYAIVDATLLAQELKELGVVIPNVATSAAEWDALINELREISGKFLAVAAPR